MSVQHFASLVLITVVNHRTVVAGENKQSVIGNAQTIQCIHNLTNGPVQLKDYVTTGTETTLSGKTRMRNARHMYILCTHVQEERFIGRRTDKVLRFFSDDIGNFLVIPQGRLTSRHPSDTRNTVDNGIVMSLTRFQFHQFRILFTRRPVAYFMVIADSNRVGRIQSGHSSVFHKHTRHTVYRSRNNKFIIKSDTLGIRFDEPVKISSSNRSQSQMPFSDRTGMIARFMEHISQCDTCSINNQLRITRSDTCIFLSPRITSGQHTVTRRSTRSRSCIGIGKLYSLSRQFINVRRRNLRSPVTTQITDTQVVRINKNHIRTLQVRSFLLLRLTTSGQSRQSGKGRNTN